LPDPRLQEAQTAFAEATKLQEAEKYAEAITQGERALELREAALGPMDPEVASALNNLALAYASQGQYERARPLYERASAIWEMTLGGKHPNVAMVLNNLGLLYQGQGLYNRAEPLYQRALAIREEAGTDHPSFAETLNNLAFLYTEQGLYGRAEPLYQRALAILEEARGKNHLDISRPLNNLANLYMAQGLYSQAGPLYERALAIREKELGGKNSLVADALVNLASLYSAQGEDSRAESLCARALAIREEILGKKHRDVASTLNNLAVLYANQGQYERARPLYERALSIREEVLGKRHPEVASALNNLALLYSQQGLYARAGTLFERALAIYEKALGGSHPLVANALNNLARNRLAQQRLGEALPLYRRAFTISERRLRQEALDFSETRLSSFLQYLRADEEHLYTLLRAHPKDAHVQRLALSAALLLKGRSVEEMADTSRTIYRSLSPQDRGTLERLRGLRTQLAKQSLEGPGSLTPADYQKLLKELASQGDALEADLARRSAPLRALARLPDPGEIVGRVAAALPKDSALVEFIAYTDLPLIPLSGQPASQVPGQLRYLALVLLPDASTRAVDLGPAEPIDRAALGLRSALADRDASYQASAQALYEQVFQPLLPALGDSHRLFLSTDGQLALVSFAALHDGRRFLIDAFDFTYLTSGKDVLPGSPGLPPAASVVVFAAPDFSASSPTASASPGQASTLAERSAGLERALSAEYENRVGGPRVSLPGTRQEAEAIQHLIPQAQLFLGSEASKDRLLHLPTPGVLHLATHGFFLEDAPAPDGSRTPAHFGAIGSEPIAPRLPDPLLRSGLVLAGGYAPTSSVSRPAMPSSEGTLVTALELAGLNLWGTQLVVLSACDTGRGDVKLGQGVYGLRRAFMVAGAETVVMSLWRVDDQMTRRLMEAYYRNLLAGQGRAAALGEAMRALRFTQEHPHYWAPFIAVGRNTPVRALAPNRQGAQK
jgi:CHAT domain-containing protein